MVNQYETVFIMTPVLSDEQIEETVKKYTKLLTKGGAKIVYEKNWRLKKLAYPIQKKSTGFYYCIEFEGPGEVIRGVEIAFKRDERILRFLTIKLDKHAVAFNEKSRKKPESKASKADTDEEVAEKETKESKPVADEPLVKTDTKEKEEAKETISN